MRYTDFHTSFTRRGSHCAFNRAEPHNSAGQMRRRAVLVSNCREEEDEVQASRHRPPTGEEPNEPSRGGGRSAGEGRRSEEPAGRRSEESAGEKLGRAAAGEAAGGPRRRPRARQPSAPPLAGGS
jgi:hypothetical protein